MCAAPVVATVAPLTSEVASVIVFRALLLLISGALSGSLYRPLIDTLVLVFAVLYHLAQAPE